MRHLLLSAVIALAAVSLNAQQLEPNDAGGTFTRAGMNPTPGTPFNVFTGNPMDLRIGGAPNSGYILVLGNLATTSLFIAFGINQYLDIDQNGAVVVGDGIGFTGNLPPAWFFTGNTGQSNWAVPTNPAMSGQSYAFQAVVADATLPPIFLNFTAAAEYYINPATQLAAWQGDDVAMQVTTTNAYTLYGVARTQFQVSSNGFIKVTGTGTPPSDLSETAAEMISGMPGTTLAGTNAPVLAVMWEDLDLANNATQLVRVLEDVTNAVVYFQWINGEYWSTSPNWGTVEARLTDLGGSSQIEYDYTAFLPAVAPSEGIVGVSDGNTGVPAGANVQANIIVGGAVVGYTSAGDNDTYFQTFDGLGGGGVVAEPIDVAGKVITFIDTNGLGNYTVF